MWCRPAGGERPEREIKDSISLSLSLDPSLVSLSISGVRVADGSQEAQKTEKPEDWKTKGSEDQSPPPTSRPEGKGEGALPFQVCGHLSPTRLRSRSRL